MRELAARSGAHASVAGQREAAERADVVILAVPGEALDEVVRSVGDLAGKVVVDMTSAPKRQAGDGYMELLSDSSNSERIPPGMLVWVPLQQGRAEGVELKLLRSSLLPCFVRLTEGLTPPRDVDALARIPQRELPRPCEAWRLR